MNRRRFLMGTLASGLAFMAKPVFLFGPKAIQICSDPVTRMQRICRLFDLEPSQRHKCRIMYILKDDPTRYAMPPICQVNADRKEGTMQFVAERLQISITKSFIGCTIVDDENYELTNGITKFDTGPIHVTLGDKLDVSFTVKVNQS